MLKNLTNVLKRICLKCNKSFRSYSVGHRICPKCAEKNANESGIRVMSVNVNECRQQLKSEDY